MIYLDHAATTPLDPQALDAMLPWLREDFGNPASDHALGRKARAAVEQARAQVATLIGATPEEVLFTSGATESNNLAIKGALEFRGLKNAHIVTSRIEHKAVLDTCRWLETQGVRVTTLKPDAQGRISPEQVMAALTPQTLLVSLMWVNNEIGVINDIPALAPLLRERGILLHVDAAQAAGKLPVNLAEVPVDLLSVSAHKLGGPKGIGALFVRKRPRARLAPQMHGGGHEQGMRSGTLATHQIVGLGAACQLAQERLTTDAPALTALRDALWQRLSVLPGTHLNASEAPRAPHVLNVSFEGVNGESLRALLSDVAVSSGSACSSATREPSYVLRALGRSDELAGASLRFSFGHTTALADIEQAAERVMAAVTRLRSTQGYVPMPQIENIFGYPAPIWQRFLAPQFSGKLPEGLRVEVGTPAESARLTLSVRPGEKARFLARGCPVTVAVGEWLAEQLSQPTVDLAEITAACMRAALEIPEDKTHCSLMGEDLVHALQRQMTT